MPTLQTTLVERLREERVLLTGGTGFLGQAVLEKLLRVTPEGGPVYLLVRARAGEPGAERIRRDVLASTVFDRLRATLGPAFDRLGDRLVPVEGDLTEPRLGLTAERWAEVAGAITAVVHCAAACAFDQPLDQALRTNTFGPRSLLSLAAEAGDVPLVHVSTAYVNGERTDRLPEEVLPPGHTVRSYMEGASPDGSPGPAERARSLLEAAEEARRGVDADEGDAVVREMGMEVARRHGWWNAYTFTKALGEQLLQMEHGSVPVAIVRPSVIEGAYREPLPGWIDRPRVSALLADVGQGRLPALPGRPGAALDVVPVDMAANATLAALPPEPGRGTLTVYHVGAGPDHTVPLERLSEWLAEAARNNPIRDEGGRPVEPTGLQLVTPERLEGLLQRREDRARRRREEARADDRDADARSAALEARLLARLRAMMRMYVPFVGPAPLLDRTNLEALARGLAPGDRETFPFDPAVVDWRRYLRECELPGVYRALGKGPTTSTAFRRRVEDAVGGAGDLDALLDAAGELFGDHPTVLETWGPAPRVLRWRELGARVGVIRESFRKARLTSGASVALGGHLSGDALAAWLAAVECGLRPRWVADGAAAAEGAPPSPGIEAAVRLSATADSGSAVRIERVASVGAAGSPGETPSGEPLDPGPGGAPPEETALARLRAALESIAREPVSLRCLSRSPRESPELPALVAEALMGTTLAFVEP